MLIPLLSVFLQNKRRSAGEPGRIGPSDRSVETAPMNKGNLGEKLSGLKPVDGFFHIPEDAMFNRVIIIFR